MTEISRPTASPTSETARPPPGLRLYAVGDIHGCADLLERLLERIAEDAAAHPEAAAEVVFLGDYVDRGPDSRAVLERLAGPPPDGLAFTCLKGNHEAMLLEALSDPRRLEFWLLNGGAETLHAYGVAPQDGAAALMAAFGRALPARHREWLLRLKLWARFDDYLFVHAGIRPGCPIDRQRPEDLLWIRTPFLNSRDDHGVVVVHGHSITRQPELWANRIGIDTGAVVTGRLTAAVLGDGPPSFLRVCR